MSLNPSKSKCYLKWEITMISSVKSGKLQGHLMSMEGVTTDEY